jgi:N-acetylmuramoyl-L-alanine amidase
MPKIGLDIGHEHDTYESTGGKGVKVNGRVYEEHTFNSALGNALEKELKRHGFDIYSSQSSSLRTRTNYYNAKQVDIVVSLHANYNSNPDVKGVCVFGWHNHPDSQKLQNFLIDEFRKAGLDTHGNGDHDSEIGSWTELAITRDTKMTAVLVENGFMGNPSDFQKLFIDTDDYVSQLVPAYTKAICRYFNIPYKEVKAMSQKNVKLTPAQEAIQKEAIRLGLTDGKNPHREPNQMYVWQVMIPLARKVEQLLKEIKDLKK